MENLANKITYRPYALSDYAQVKSVMQAAYADLEDAYAPEEEMCLLHSLYPQGQVVALLEDKIIGINLCRVVPYQVYTQAHTQMDIIDLSRYINDTFEGDCVNTMDIVVSPQYHNLKIGQQLMNIFLARAAFKDNFKAMIGTSRLGSYHLYQHEFPIEEYVQKVCNKELHDAVLSFHLRNGMEYISVAPNYSPGDKTSLGYGVILTHVNPSYNPNLPTFEERQANVERAKKLNLG